MSWFLRAVSHKSGWGKYVVRVRAYNQFGQGPYGTQSYAVQLATKPTEPLDVAIGSPAADGEYSANPNEVTLVWSQPHNFATGTDDCSGSDDAAARDSGDVPMVRPPTDSHRAERCL